MILALWLIVAVCSVCNMRLAPVYIITVWLFGWAGLLVSLAIIVCIVLVQIAQE